MSLQIHILNSQSARPPRGMKFYRFRYRFVEDKFRFVSDFKGGRVPLSTRKRPLKRLSIWTTLCSTFFQFFFDNNLWGAYAKAMNIDDATFRTLHMLRLCCGELLRGTGWLRCPSWWQRRSTIIIRRLTCHRSLRRRETKRGMLLLPRNKSHIRSMKLSNEAKAGVVLFLQGIKQWCYCSWSIFSVGVSVSPFVLSFGELCEIPSLDYCNLSFLQ